MGQQHRNPYAVLNLPENGRQLSQQLTHRSQKGSRQRVFRNISDEEIRDAYKRLSRIFHPDKRPPGEERDDAQEMFNELLDAYDILRDPALRQAYDHFGYDAVNLVRHFKHNSNSLYIRLSKLHDRKKTTEALELLRAEFDHWRWEQHKDEWEFNANVGIHMNATADPDLNGEREWPEVESTNMSVSAVVPIQQNDAAQERRMQLAIGGQSNLENGLGTNQGYLATSFRPVIGTDISSELEVGTKHVQTTLSTMRELSSGTVVNAKMGRRYEAGDENGGKLFLAFTSNRVLTLFPGRRIHALFSFGMGPDFDLHYGLFQFTTYRFFPKPEEDDTQKKADNEESYREDDDFDSQSQNEGEKSTRSKSCSNQSSASKSSQPPPRITVKLGLKMPSPISFTIFQPHLFHSPHRSGKITASWSLFSGLQLKGLIQREVSTKWSTAANTMNGNNEEKKNTKSRIGLGLEHTATKGLTWLIRYDHPEGITLQIPILVAGFFSPGYFQQAFRVSLFSFVLIEALGEFVGHTSVFESIDDELASAINETYVKIDDKTKINDKELEWMNSSAAQAEADRQSCMMEPIAAMKRKQEDASGGLVILKAMYSIDSSSSSSVPVDVTSQLQFWTYKSTLNLPAKSKSLLLGFYDLREQGNIPFSRKRSNTIGDDSSKNSVFSLVIEPIINWFLRSVVSDVRDKSSFATEENSFESDPILSVRYKFNDEVYEMIVRDNEALELPNNSALHLGSSNLVN